jgi:hypothetical protein
MPSKERQNRNRLIIRRLENMTFYIAKATLLHGKTYAFAR